MRRLVDRSRTGRRRTRRPNRRRRSAGEDCGKVREAIPESSCGRFCDESFTESRPAQFLSGMIALAGPAVVQIKTGATATEIAEAARPIDEGVPEVAVYQLQKLVTRLNGADAIKAKEKLAEALIAARRSTEALRLLEEPVLRDSTSGKFLRAQAFAALNRSRAKRSIVSRGREEQQRAATGCCRIRSWRKCCGRSIEPTKPFGLITRSKTIRALVFRRVCGRRNCLSRNKTVSWPSAFLMARRPKSRPINGKNACLHARIELLNQKPEKAIGLLDSLVKKPENESRETAIAALFAMADAHLQMNTPEAGDDYLEDFIDRHPS